MMLFCRNHIWAFVSMYAQALGTIMAPILFAAPAALALAAKENNNSALRSESDHAFALLSEAVSADRTLPAFVTTQYEVSGPRSVAIRSYISNGPGRTRLTRREVTRYIDSTLLTSVTYISNLEGIWKIENSTIAQIPNEPPLERPVPVRLVTADLLGVPPTAVEYRIDNNMSYFGMPAVRITATLAESVINNLKAHPELLKEALKKDGGIKSGTSAAENDWRKEAEKRLPVAYVYMLHTEKPFVLCWQAYSLSGDLVSEVSHQEFKVMVAIPAEVFDPHTVFASQSKKAPAHR